MNAAAVRTITERAARLGIAAHALPREAGAAPGFHALEPASGAARAAVRGEDGSGVLLTAAAPGGAAALSVLSDCWADLCAAGGFEREYDVFARHLEHSYDSTTLLYGLARKLGDVRRAPWFVAEALDGLVSALSCCWGALVLRRARRTGEVELAEVTVRSPSAQTRDEVALRIAAAAEGLAARAVRGIVTGYDDLRAEELLVHPVSLAGRSEGWVILGKCPSHLGEAEDAHASSYDTQAVEIVAGFVTTMLEGLGLYHEQEMTYMGSLHALTQSLEAKDPYTRGHSERVALLATRLAEASGLDEAAVRRVHLAGTLHDIGKIGVPDRVLCKPGRLSDEEFEAIKQHPRIGHEILVGIPALADILPGVLHHHERWDGRGYPHGLAGAGIPLLARLLALADTFDAMSSNRAYRSGRPREAVLEEFERCAGTQFDPALVGPFVRLDFAEFDAMKAEHEAGELGNQRIEMAA